MEIARGLWTALDGLAGELSAHLRDVEPGVAVLVSVIVGVLCGAWLVHAPGSAHARCPVRLGVLAAAAVAGGIQRLVRVPRLRHADQGEVPSLCHNHFLAASRYEWEHRPGWGKRDKAVGCLLRVPAGA